MYKRFLGSGRQAIWVAMLAVAATVVSARPATGYTPESPKVKQVVARAVKYLESDDARDARVGARALVGLVLVKSGAKRDHPKILEAVDAIRAVVKDHDPAKIMLDDKVIYHVGLAAMFLVAHDPIGHRADIECLLKYLQLVQKEHGGWGYPNKEPGDTSMTQYGVLSAWEATQAGFHIPPDSIEGVATWLLRTQDPSGGFGYQGILSPTFTPVKQDSTPISLGAAGLGSVYICADLLGLIAKVEAPRDDLPPALQEVKKDKPAEGAAGAGTRLDPRLFVEVQRRGLAWLGQNYRIDPGRYTHYYLYALERCMSFRELAEGKAGGQKAADGPVWYNDGVEFLAATQKEDGCWKGDCGPTADTAFGVLFLIRSTQKSIAKAHNFGDGTLIGGRGLPKETGRAQLSDGEVVAKPLLGPAEQLLAVLESTEVPDYGKTIDLLAELPPQEAEALMEKHGQKLRRLAGDQSPQARMAAVRALAKTRDVDNVPTLIYALTDPDPEIVIAARDGLRRISRRPAGFGLPDRPSEEERRAAVQQWKAWYLAIRPAAEFEN